MKEKLNGYQMYGCLMSMLKEETAEWLHENSRSPISQHIIYDKNSFQWEINLFDEILSYEIGEVLSDTKEFHAQKAGIDLYIDSVKHEELKDFSDIRKQSIQLMKSGNTEIYFRTTTALKKDGEFLLFPDMELILKNWWNTWNSIFPNNPFDDEDALRLILKNTYIQSYRLSSSIHRMKGNNIKGFYGNMTIGNRLSEPMRELLNALLVMSEYSGTGVKTALGMGKTTIMTAMLHRGQ